MCADPTNWKHLTQDLRCHVWTCVGLRMGFRGTFPLRLLSNARAPILYWVSTDGLERRLRGLSPGIIEDLNPRAMTLALVNADMARVVILKQLRIRQPCSVRWHTPPNRIPTPMISVISAHVQRTRHQIVQLLGHSGSHSGQSPKHSVPSPCGVAKCWNNTHDMSTGRINPPPKIYKFTSLLVTLCFTLQLCFAKGLVAVYVVAKIQFQFLVIQLGTSSTVAHSDFFSESSAVMTRVWGGFCRKPGCVPLSNTIIMTGGPLVAHLSDFTSRMGLETVPFQSTKCRGFFRRTLPWSDERSS